MGCIASKVPNIDDNDEEENVESDAKHHESRVDSQTSETYQDVQGIDLQNVPNYQQYPANVATRLQLDSASNTVHFKPSNIPFLDYNSNHQLSNTHRNSNYNFPIDNTMIGTSTVSFESQITNGANTDIYKHQHWMSHSNHNTNTNTNTTTNTTTTNTNTNTNANTNRNSIASVANVNIVRNNSPNQHQHNISSKHKNNNSMSIQIDDGGGDDHDNGNGDGNKDNKDDKDGKDGVAKCDEKTTGHKHIFGNMSGDENGYLSNNVVINNNNNDNSNNDNYIKNHNTNSSNIINDIINNNSNININNKIIDNRDNESDYKDGGITGYANSYHNDYNYVVSKRNINIHHAHSHSNSHSNSNSNSNSSSSSSSSQIVHFYPIETIGNPLITLCGNDSTDDDKLFIIQQLHCYYNYNYTIKNHNNQLATELGGFAYGSYHFNSIKNALIELNSKLGDDDVYGINMMLPLDIINMILQYYELIIIDSILHDNTFYNKQNDDKTHGKSVKINSNISVNSDEHGNKLIKKVKYKSVEKQIEYKVFFAQFYSHYSNNFDSQIQHYFGNYNNNKNNNNSYSLQNHNNNTTTTNNNTSNNNNNRNNRNARTIRRFGLSVRPVVKPIHSTIYFVNLLDYLTPVENDSTSYLRRYSTIKHFEQLLKEYANYLQHLKTVGHVKNSKPCTTKIYIIFTHFEQFDKDLSKNPLLFDVIYFDLKEFLIDKRLFIPVQYSDDSDMYSINGSKRYYKIKELKHKFDMFNCQSKIGNGHVAMDIILFIFNNVFNTVCKDSDIISENIRDRERNNCLPFKFCYYIMNENILYKVGQRQQQQKQEYIMNKDKKHNLKNRFNGFGYDYGYSKNIENYFVDRYNKTSIVDIFENVYKEMEA